MNIFKQAVLVLAFCIRGLKLSGSLGIVFMPMLLMAQGPSVAGSFPRDGAQNLLRNLFVSAGLILPNQVGIDLATLNDSTVRLYPQAQPDSLVASLVTTDTRVKNITLEPITVLAPNTTYTFEITEGVLDEGGLPFNPYKISFTTGEKAIKKRITIEKPRLQKEEESGETLQPTDSMIGPDLTRLVEVTTGEFLKKEIVAVEAEVSSTPTEKAPDTVEPSAEAENPTNKIALASTETTTKTAEETKEASPAKVVPKKKEVKIKKVFFPKKRLAKDSKFPIQFNLDKRQQVRMIIKSSVGTVVKRRGGVINTGKQQFSISLKGIPAGSYTVFLVAGELKLKHRIVIE